jgi:ssDNA-binding Zn-finger/Zn-ribbon topoisomerase 1
MHNTEYYFENSFAMLLSRQSYEKLSKETETFKMKCKECGSPVILIQMFEGAFLCCSANMYNKHKIGYELVEDFPRYEKEAYIKEL